MSSAVRRVQTWYPQIYLACHTEHRRGGRAPGGVSPRDSALLAHLDEESGMTPAALARHLGIGAPALSAAVKRLSARGYIVLERDPSDGRRRRLRLTASGRRAVSAGSVLETGRVRALLRRLDPGERTRALDGLALLARAARETRRQNP